MSSYPCKGCIIGTVCSEGCDKLHDNYIGGIYGFIDRFRCCPDCGGTEGIIFYEFEFIKCKVCNSLFNSSPSERPRYITRWVITKHSKGSNDVYKSFDMTFGAFVDKIKEFRKLQRY